MCGYKNFFLLLKFKDSFWNLKEVDLGKMKSSMFILWMVSD